MAWFGKDKLDKMMEARREENKEKEAENSSDADDDKVELEKGDMLAIIIAAFLSLLPALFIVIGFILFVYWIFMR